MGRHECTKFQFNTIIHTFCFLRCFQSNQKETEKKTLSYLFNWNPYGHASIYIYNKPTYARQRNRERDLDTNLLFVFLNSFDSHLLF